MNRESAKKLWPIIQAYSEGKTIQVLTHITNEWLDVYEPVFNTVKPEHYRIKPEPKYRPYNNEEMRNLVGKAVVHVNAPNDTYLVTSCIEGCIEVFYNQKSYKYNAEELFRNWTINGKRCGVEK